MLTARLAAGAIVLACASACLAGAASGPATQPSGAPASQPAGLAAKYTNDAGIAADPSVVLHEDFEAGIFDESKWSNIKGHRKGYMKIVDEPANVFGGRRAVQMTAVLGESDGGHLFKRWKDRGWDQLYARFMVKFAADCDYIHHFVQMNAELPATPWPQGQAGVLPRGDQRFSCAIEPWGKWRRYPPPGGWHFYCYWWKMKKSPDGKYWGNGFAPDAYAVPQRGRWYCVEFMCKANTPGNDDGQAAFWLDGVRLAHHTDINWRSDATLKLNAFWLMLYVTENSAKTNKVNTVWFDDVVVATQYIGPPNRPFSGDSLPALGVVASLRPCKLSPENLAGD